MHSHWILRVRVDDLSDDELSETLRSWLSFGDTRLVVTPNPEMILVATKDPDFQEVLNRADLNLPDGVGLKFAVPFATGTALRWRHTGVDTLQLLVKFCVQSQRSIALIGGDPGVAERAAEVFRTEWPQLDVMGVNPGPVSDVPGMNFERMRQLAERVRSVSVIAVGLGQGKQERFMEQLADALESAPRPRILIGVGGAFDMVSGAKRRAPAGIRRLGLEWAWRLAMEPSRWRRIARAVVVFPLAVVFDRLGRKTLSR